MEIMGLFLCAVCDEQLSLDKHVCNPEKIREHIKFLKDAQRIAESRLNEMQNAVHMVIHELPSIEGEKISVNAEWIRKLWDATQNQWYETKTPEKFLVRWIVTHRILCEAYDVFRSKKNETLLQKLKNLREACDQSKETLGYQDSKFDLSPEDLIS